AHFLFGALKRVDRVSQRFGRLSVLRISLRHASTSGLLSSAAGCLRRRAALSALTGQTGLLLPLGVLCELLHLLPELLGFTSQLLFLPALFEWLLLTL